MLKGLQYWALLSLVSAGGNLIPPGSKVSYTGELAGGTPDMVLNGNIYPGSQTTAGDCLTIVGPNPKITIAFADQAVVNARTVFIGAKDSQYGPGGTYATAPNGIANSRLSFLDLAGNKTICNKLITGTGFYDCDASGVALQIENSASAPGTELTVCEVRLYEHPNIIAQATAYASGADVLSSETKLLTKAPLQYEKGGATSWYQSTNGPPFWVAFWFPDRRQISDVVFIGDPDYPNDSKNFKLTVDSSPCDGGKLQTEPMPQHGLFKEVPCNLTGNTVTATKEDTICSSSTNCFSAVGVAIMQSSCADCSQFQFQNISNVSESIDGGRVARFNLNINTCPSCPIQVTLLDLGTNSQPPTWISWQSPNLVVNTAAYTGTANATYQIKWTASLLADPTITTTATVTFTIQCTPTKLIMTAPMNGGVDQIVLVSDSSSYASYNFPTYVQDRICPGSGTSKITRVLSQVSPSGTTAVSLFKLDLVKMNQITKAFTADYTMQITTGIKGTTITDTQTFKIKVIDCSITLTSDLPTNSFTISRNNPIVETRIYINQSHTDPLCPSPNYFTLAIMNALPFVTFNSPVLKATYIPGQQQASQQVTISAVYSLKFADFKQIIVFYFQMELDPCLQTVISKPMIPSISGYALRTYDFPLPALQDSVSLAKGVDGYCGPFQITLDTNCCLKVNGASLTLNGTSATSYTTKLTVTLTALPNVPSSVQTIPVTIAPPCYTTMLSFTQTPENTTYIIGQPALVTSQFIAGPSPQCSTSISYSAAFFDTNGAQLAVSFAQFASQAFLIETFSRTSAGSYRAEVTATLLDKKVVQSWTLNVFDRCIQTILLADLDLSDGIAMYVDDAPPSSPMLVFGDTVSFTYGDGFHVCGDRTIQLATSTTLVSVTGQTLGVRGATFADFGRHDITLQVSLVKYPEVKPLRQTFTVYVLLHCERAQIVETTPAKDMWFQIGQQPSTQSLSFLSDTESVARQVSNVCGAKQYLITSPVGFMTISNDAIKIETFDVKDVGQHTIQVKVWLQDYPDVVGMFQVNVDICANSVLSFTQKPELTIYTRGQGPYESPQVKVTPAQACGQITVFTAAYNTKQGPVVSLSFVTFALDRFHLDAQKIDDVGSYEVIITAKLISQQVAYSWHFEVIDPCTTTIIQGLALSTYVISVSRPPLVVNLNTVDYASLLYGDHTGLTFCGPKSYSLVAESSVATIKDGVLKLASSQIGTYQLSIVAAMSQYPQVPATTSQLRVEVICATQSLEFINKIYDFISYTVGDYQFITPTWELQQSPACDNEVNYSLNIVRGGRTIDGGSLFMLKTAGGSVGFIVISTVDNADAGNYNITVIASVDDKVKTDFTFAVQIKAYVPQVFTPIPDMIYVIGQGVMQSEPLVLYPPVANEIASYTILYQTGTSTVNSLAFVSFTGGQFTVDAAIESQLGTYTALISIQVGDYLLDSQWLLEVVDLCADTIIQEDSALAGINLDVGSDPMAPVILQYVDSVSQQWGDMSGMTFCGTKIVSMLQSDSDILQLNGSTLSTRSVTYEEVGTHTFTLQVSMKDHPSAQPLLQTVTIQVSCTVKTLAFLTTFDSFQYTVGDYDFITPTWELQQSPSCQSEIHYSLIVSKEGKTIDGGSVFKLMASDGASGFVVISTGDNARAGNYSITVIASIDDNVKADFTFPVKIEAYIPQVWTPIPDMIYVIGQGFLQSEPLILYPQVANEIASYTVEYQTETSIVDNLPFISFSDGMFTVEATAESQAGTYTALISIQVGDYLLDTQWMLEVVDLCANTIIQEETDLKAVTLYVGENTMAPVSLQFVDSVSQEWGDMSGMTFCGQKVISLLQSDSDILQLNGSTLSTRSVTYEDVGTHTFTLQVSMKDHPSAQPLLQTVTVLVNCTVKTLAFSTTFDSFQYTVGDYEFITPTWEMQQSPACQCEIDYNLIVQKEGKTIDGDSVLKLIARDEASGFVVISTGDNAKAGSYSITIIASVDDQVKTDFTFAVEIQAYIPQIWTPIPDMTYVIGQGIVQSEPLSLYPQVANEIASYTVVYQTETSIVESLPFISFSDGMFTVEATTESQAGTYTAQISIQVEGYLLDSQWMLQVVDLCANTIIQEDPALTGINLDVGSDPMTPVSLQFIDSVSQEWGDIKGKTFCGEKVVSLLQSDSQILQLNGSTLSTRSVTYEDVGTHTFTLQVSMKDHPSAQPLLQTVTVRVNCTVKTLAFLTPFDSFLYTIGEYEFITPTWELQQSPACQCEIDYNLVVQKEGKTIDSGSVFKLMASDGASGFVVISTGDNAKVGKYSITVIASVDDQVKTDFTFAVEIQAYIPQIWTPIPDMTYVIGQGIVQSEPLTLYPQVANEIASYTVVYQTETSIVDNLSFVNFSDGIFTVEATTESQVGTYTALISVQVGDYLLDSQWLLECVDLCANTIIQEDTDLKDLTLYVGGNTMAPVSLQFIDSVSQEWGDMTGMTFCGVKVVTLLQSDSDILQLNGSTLSTRSVTYEDVGTHTYTLKVSMKDHPSAQPLLQTVTVRVNCTVKTLAFLTTFDSFACTVGDYEFITPTWELQQTPSCQSNINYSLIVKRDGKTIDIGLFKLIARDEASGFVVISTDDNARAGKYSITVIASIDDQLKTDFTFAVEIQAYIPQIWTPIPDMTYVIGQGVVQSEPLVLYPQVANEIASYTVVYQTETSIVESLPFVSFSDGKFTVEATTESQAGTYTAQISIKVGDYLLDSQWLLEVVDLCANTIIQENANLSEIQLDVGGDPITTMSLQFVDSVSQEWGDMSGMTFCGAKVVTLLQSDSDILQLNGSVLSTRPLTYQDVGTHTFTLQAQMKDHPSAQPLQQTVTVNVSCTVKTLTVKQSFTWVSYFVEDPRFVTEPILADQSPYCGLNVTYQVIVIKGGQSLLQQTIIRAEADKGIFGISTDQATDIGEYQVSVQMIVQNQQAATSFTLSIKDQALKKCPLASITLSEPIKDIYYQLGRQTTVESLTIISDSESQARQTPNYCGAFEYQLTPTFSFIGISNNALQLSTSNLSDLGSYPMQLSVWLKDYPQIKASYSFNVDICANSILMFTRTPELTTYTRGQGPYESPQVTTTPALVCGQKTVFTVAYNTKSGPVNSLSFLIFAQDKFHIDTQQIDDVGSYEVVITATSLNNQATFSWLFEVTDPCTQTVINPLDKSDYTIRVSKPPVLVNLSSTDQMSLQYGDQTGLTLCGPKIYSFVGDSSIGTIKDGALELVSSQMGTYELSIVAALSRYPQVPQTTSKLRVKVSCASESLEFISKFEEKFFYTVGDQEIITPTWELQQTPACDNEVAYGLNVVKDGLEIYGGSVFKLFFRDEASGFGVIQTHDNSRAGNYSITVIASVDDQVKTDFTFAVEIKAYVPQVWTPISEMIYVIGQGVVQSEPLVLYPQIANEIASYTILYQTETSTVQSLSFVSFSDGKFTVDATTESQAGTYTAQISIQVGDYLLDSQWMLQLVDLCKETIIQEDSTLTGINLEVGGDLMTPISLQFVDSVSQEWGDMSGMTFCGAKVATLLQSDSDILQLNGPVLSTRSVTYQEVGTHTFTLQVSMKDHPSAQPLLQTVTVNVSCTVKMLTVKQSLASILYLVGDPKVVTDPIQVAQSPQCGLMMNYQVVVIRDGSPLLDQTVIKTGLIQGTVEIFTDQLADIGQYQVSVQIIAQNLQKTTNFTVLVSDKITQACQKATITPSEQIKDMLIKIGQQPVVQSLSTISDTESQARQTPNYCGAFEYELTPAYSFIGISNNALQLSTSNLSDVGYYPIQLSVWLKDYPQIKAIYSFNVSVSACQISEIDSPSAEFTYVYQIGSGPQQISLDFQASETCGTQMKYFADLLSLPFLTRNQDILTINTSDPISVGTFHVRVSASLNGKQATRTLNLSVVDPCTSTQIEDVSMNTNLTIKVQGDRLIYMLPAFIDSQSLLFGDKQGTSFCGPRQYTLLQPISFMNLNGEALILQTDRPTDVGFYEVTLTVSLMRYPNVRPLSKTLSINVICENSRFELSNPIQDFSYEVGSAVHTSDPWQAMQTPSCGNWISYETSVTKDGNQIYGQSVFLFERDRLKVFTTNQQDIGTYVIKVSARLQASKTTFLTQSFSFKVDVTAPTMPAIMQPEPVAFGFSVPDQIVKVGNPLSVKVPTPDEQTVVTVNFSKAPFLAYDERSMTFSIAEGVTRAQDAGVYDIKVRWITPDMHVHEHTFLICITTKAKVQSLNQGSESALQTYYSDVYDVSMGRTDAEIQQIVSNIRTKILAQQFSASAAPQEPTFIEPQISQITPNSLVVISFSSPVYTDLPLETIKTGVYVEPSTGRLLEQTEQFQAIQLTLIPGGSSVPKDLDFKWEYLGFTPKGDLQLRLDFEKPSAVSAFTEPDQLTIKFAYSQLFFDKNGNYVRPNAQITRELPPQIENAEYNAIQKTASTAKAVAGTAVSGNFAFNLIAASSLNYLWSMINAQQIVVLCPLLRVNLPANATMMFNTLLTIASFDIIPTDMIYSRLNLFKQHQGTLDKNFRAMSFNSELFIPNAGAQFIAFLVICLTLALLKATVCCRNVPCFGVTRHRFKNMLIWNFLIRMAIECYVFVVLCCLINLQNASFSDPEVSVNTVISLLFFAACVAYPPGFLWILRNRHRHLRKPSTQDRIGEAYKELAINKGPHILNYTILFHARRLVLPVLIIFSKTFAVQFSVFVLTVIANVAFTSTFRPFKEAKKHILEQLNELVILVILYHMFLLQDSESPYKMRTYLGASCCFIVLLSLLVNIVIIMEEQITSFIRYCEIKYHLYKAKKKLAAQKQEVKENFGEQRHANSIRKSQMRQRLMSLPKKIEEIEVDSKPDFPYHQRQNSSDRLLSTDISTDKRSARSESSKSMTLISLMSRQKSSVRSKIVPIAECQDEDLQSPPRHPKSPGKFWRMWSASSNKSSPVSSQRKGHIKHRQFSDLIKDEEELKSGIERLRSELPPDLSINESEQSEKQESDPHIDLQETARLENLHIDTPIEFNVRRSAIVSMDATRYPSLDKTIDAKPCLFTLKNEKCVSLEELVEPDCPLQDLLRVSQGSIAKRDDTESSLSKIINQIEEEGTPEREPSLPHDDSISQCSQLKSVARSNLMRSALKSQSSCSPVKENMSQKRRWHLNFGKDGALSNVLNIDGSADELAHDIENQRSTLLRKVAGQIVQNYQSPEKKGGTEIKKKPKQQLSTFALIAKDEASSPIRRPLFPIQKPQSVQKSEMTQQLAYFKESFHSRAVNR